MSDGVMVRGTATAEEVAAVLAVLARVGDEAPVADGYARWREGRRRALQASPRSAERPG
jgi:hypothetical protein